MFTIRSIPPDQPRGWEVFVDGLKINANLVKLVSSRWGQLTYGLRPEGFDSWVYKMRNSAVTVPYSIIGARRKKLLVGLALERRSNMGDNELCVVGGFTDPGEDIDTAQEREASEEVGLTGKARRLGGRMVSDRLFWDASEEEYGGVITFAKKISPRHLHESGNGEWRLNEGTLKFKGESALVFMEWGTAVDCTKDGIALAALARIRRGYELSQL